MPDQLPGPAPRQIARYPARIGCASQVFGACIMMMFVVTVLVLMGLFLLYLYARVSNRLPRQGPPTIDQIRELKELSVLRVEESIIQETQIRGYVGSQRLLALYRGELTIGVDLSDAKIIDTDEEAGIITISLPALRITSARLNHEPVELLLLRRRGLWLLAPIDDPTEKLLQQSLKEAQQQLTRQMMTPAWQQQAKQSTLRLLDELARPCGWQVHVQWQP